MVERVKGILNERDPPGVRQSEKDSVCLRVRSEQKRTSKERRRSRTDRTWYMPDSGRTLSQGTNDIGRGKASRGSRAEQI